MLALMTFNIPKVMTMSSIRGQLFWDDI